MTSFPLNRRTLLHAAMGVAASALPFSKSAIGQEQPVIRVANLELGTNLPVYYLPKVAEKHGIQVEIINFRRGLEAAQALKAGEVDVAVGGIEAAIAAHASGTPAVVLANYCSGGIVWTQRPDLGMKEVADLKGRRFATIRGMHEVLMRVEFELAGLSVSEQPGEADVQAIFLNSGPAIATALRTGEADAMTNAEPLPSRSIAEGYGAPFIVPDNTPIGIAPRAFFIDRGFLEQHPEASQRLVDALVDSAKTLRDNADLAREFAVKDALEGTITDDDWHLMFDSGHTKFDVTLRMEAVQATADYMHKFGMIQKPVAATDFVDLSLLGKSLEKIGW